MLGSVMTKLKVLSWYLLGENEENHRISQPG